MSFTQLRGRKDFPSVCTRLSLVATVTDSGPVVDFEQRAVHFVRMRFVHVFDGCVFSQSVAQLHVGMRREAVRKLFVRERQCGKQVLETVTRSRDDR